MIDRYHEVEDKEFPPTPIG